MGSGAGIGGGGDTGVGWGGLRFEFGDLVHEELELGFEVGNGFGGFLVHGVGRVSWNKKQKSSEHTRTKGIG